MTRSTFRPGVILALCLTIRLLGQETQPAESPPSPLIPFETQEAIGLWPARSGVAVVTSCGVVHFLELTKGDVVRAVPTGVQGWRRPAKGDFGGHGIPTELRGAPIAVQGDEVLAVDEVRRLIAFDTKGRMRVIREDEALEGATVVRPIGKDGGILAGTNSGRVCSVEPEKALAGPGPLTEPVLVLAPAPNAKWCLSAGVGPYWHVRSLPTLALTKNAGNHIGEEFIYAIAISQDSNHIAVAHGYTTCRIKGFSVGPDGLVKEFDAFRKGGAVATCLAYDPTMRLLVAGDESGAVHVMPSGVGDAKDLPRSTRVDDAPGGPIASSSVNFATGKQIDVSDLGSWRADSEPIRGVSFADGDKLVVSVDRGGTVVARSWPSGEVKWTKKLGSLCQPDGLVTATPRTFNFGKVKPGSRKSVIVQTAGGSADLKVLEVRVEPPEAFTAKVEPVKPGERYQVTIEIAQGAKPGNVRGKAHIKTNAAEAPLEVVFYAIVQG
jgi:hypothetical protein